MLLNGVKGWIMYSLTIIGRREIIVKSTGEQAIQSEHLFSGLPEPSFDEMEAILAADAPVKSYVEWLRKDAEYFNYPSVARKNVKPYKSKPNQREQLAMEIEREASKRALHGWTLLFEY
jgi:hypothetical protein